MNLLNFGPFTLDMDRRVLLREGVPVALTPKTYETLPCSSAIRIEW